MVFKKSSKIGFTSLIFLFSSGFAEEHKKPFVLAYLPNYVGYFNNNTVSNSLSMAGHPIPQPSYIIPGIIKGYPAFDNNEVIIEQQSIYNKHLMDTIEGIDALSYGFFQPQDDGTFRFSDSWSDFKNSDLSGNGLCNTAEAQRLKICYRDGAPPFTGGATTDAQCWGNVCYGGFEAFLALNNSGENLEHYISVGGWTYRSLMDQLVAKNGEINTNNLQNFKDVIQYLHSRGVSGVDLDIEFDDSAHGYQQSLLLKALAENNLVFDVKNMGVDIAITIQANPMMLEGLMDNGWLQSWFEQGLDHFNLMTYDFHGAFDGIGRHTGFHSSLFALPDSPYGESEFSVNKAVNALSGLSLAQKSKVNIGLPAYSRAGLTEISEDNSGLFQPIGTTSGIVPGDLDATYCDNTFMPENAENQCSGTFSYGYILSNMLTPNGSFTSKTWEYTDPDSGKTYSIGSTLFGKSWQAATSTVIYDGDTPTAMPPASNNQGVYENVFMAYLTAKDAFSYGEYAKAKGLEGMILWTVNTDVSYSDKTNSLIYNFRQGYQYSEPAPEEVSILWESRGLPSTANTESGLVTVDAELVNATAGNYIEYSCRNLSNELASCRMASDGSFSLTGANIGDNIVVTAYDFLQEAQSVDSAIITIEEAEPPTDDIITGVTLYGEIQYFQVYSPIYILPRDWYHSYNLGVINLSENPVVVSPWLLGWDLSRAITCPLPESDDAVQYTISGSWYSLSCTISKN
ncbi:MAG: glycosyl hydrolase family 18 protein [Francisellaceae bacterium]